MSTRSDEFEDTFQDREYILLTDEGGYDFFVRGGWEEGRVDVNGGVVVVRRSWGVRLLETEGRGVMFVFDYDGVL